jgi:hypothetical protein
MVALFSVTYTNHWYVLWSKTRGNLEGHETEISLSHIFEFLEIGSP